MSLASGGSLRDWAAGHVTVALTDHLTRLVNRYYMA